VRLIELKMVTRKPKGFDGRHYHIVKDRWPDLHTALQAAGTISVKKACDYCTSSLTFRKRALENTEQLLRAQSEVFLLVIRNRDRDIIKLQYEIKALQKALKRCVRQQSVALEGGDIVEVLAASAMNSLGRNNGHGQALDADACRQEKMASVAKKSWKHRNGGSVRNNIVVVGKKSGSQRQVERVIRIETPARYPDKHQTSI